MNPKYAPRKFNGTEIPNHNTKIANIEPNGIAPEDPALSVLQSYRENPKEKKNRKENNNKRRKKREKKKGRKGEKKREKKRREKERK